MQGIIQVAIGLIFIYSLLSILVTTVNTVITNLLKWRAKQLKSALESLITDEEVQAQFLSHPLINIVKTRMVKPDEVGTTETAEVMALGVRNSEVNTSVTWIEPKAFAQVLSSILAEKAGFELYGPLLLAVDALPDGPMKLHMLDLVYSLQNTGTGIAELRAAIMALPPLPPEAQPTLLAALKPIEDRNAAARLSSDEGSRLLPVLDGLRRVNDDAFRRALKVILASSRTVDEAQMNMENWFNQRMDQLSDVYKRKVTYLTLFIGLVLTLVLNTDSLQMARALWEDPALREAAVSLAQQAINNGTIPTPTPFVPTATAIASVDTTPEPGALSVQAAPTEDAPDAGAIVDAAQDAAAALSQLTSLNLPIGWEYTVIEGGCTAQPEKTTPLPVECASMRNFWLLDPGNNPDWLGLIVRKLIGMVVTIIAIGQGAPFWFDLLRRLVNPRSS
ncbi:MAG: hypothetical protein ABI835_19785 [Chloroflexota bacterium]